MAIAFASMIEAPAAAAAVVQDAADKGVFAGLDSGDPRLWMLVLAAMALAPFLLTMITSFVKLVIVGSMIRSALGTQQVPPTQVITGLALILTIHVMWPTGTEIYQRFQQINVSAPAAGEVKQSEDDRDAVVRLVRAMWDAANPPIARFLRRHSHAENIALFERLQADLRQAQESDQPPLPEMPKPVFDMTVLVPAFVLSELTEAFQIGFLIFVPFLIIDLVVSNLLLAMGMFMLSPVTISLPLKILLFVLVDGWQLIIRGVILGYT